MLNFFSPSSLLAAASEQRKTQQRHTIAMERDRRRPIVDVRDFSEKKREKEEEAKRRGSRCSFKEVLLRPRSQRCVERGKPSLAGEETANWQHGAAEELFFFFDFDMLF